jgi:predicted Zn-dependent peptidase
VRLEVLPDGASLALSARPGAARSSMRYVVRTGAQEDPVGKEGLAHLLEHVLFHGSRDTGGEAFARDAHVAGASFNAFTSATTTVYVLDAPSAVFLPLADRFLRMVTNPVLPSVRLWRERGVVRSEGEVSREESGLRELLEDSLFARVRSVSLLGTEASRARIMREDLEAFYARGYTPNRTALVLAGAVTWEEGLRLAQTSVLLPPSLAEEAPVPLAAEVLLPIEQVTAAPFSLTVLGYGLDPMDREHCRFAAALLELRLVLALHVRVPVASSMAVQCAPFRGAPFLLASIYTQAFSAGASTLTDQVRDIFRELATTPPTRRELALLQRRFRAQQALLGEEEPLRADLLAQVLDQPRPAAEVLAALDPPTPADARQLRTLATRSFTDAREVSISFTPFRIP